MFSRTIFFFPRSCNFFEISRNLEMDCFFFLIITFFCGVLLYFLIIIFFCEVFTVVCLQKETLCLKPWFNNVYVCTRVFVIFTHFYFTTSFIMINDFGVPMCALEIFDCIEMNTKSPELHTYLIYEEHKWQHLNISVVFGDVDKLC